MSAPRALTEEEEKAERTRVNALVPAEVVRTLGAARCDISVLNTAKRLDPQRIYQLMPQLLERGADGKARVSAKIDFDGKEGVELEEVRAALIAASQIARARGIQLADVRLEDIKCETGADIAGQIIGEKPAPTVCKVEKPGQGDRSR